LRRTVTPKPRWTWRTRRCAGPGNGCVRLSATVGVGTTGDGTATADLLEVADLDMYRGKGRRTARGA
jgi:hypothetical protein